MKLESKRQKLLIFFIIVIIIIDSRRKLTVCQKECSQAKKDTILVFSNTKYGLSLPDEAYFFCFPSSFRDYIVESNYISPFLYGCTIAYHKLYILVITPPTSNQLDGKQTCSDVVERETGKKRKIKMTRGRAGKLPGCHHMQHNARLQVSISPGFQSKIDDKHSPRRTSEVCPSPGTSVVE